MKKIKSVKRNGLEYNRAAVDYWSSTVRIGTLTEWVHEDVIRNCPLFEVEYERGRWRAEAGKKYYYFAFIDCSIDWEYEQGRHTDLTRYDIGNYFKTKEQAQKFIESLKPIFEKFHREEGNYE